MNTSVHLAPLNAPLREEHFAPSVNQSTSRSRTTAKKLLQPDDYAKAVRHYSQVSTGAGQTHVPLANFLNDHVISIEIDTQPMKDDFVILYRLGSDVVEAPPIVSPPSPPLIQHPGHDYPDQERHSSHRSPRIFHEPKEFFSFKPNKAEQQSDIIFLRGYMSASWINHIGARYVVDPEFFCRHLDFHAPDDGFNGFSIPALPSSSWHLIELPVMTIGKKFQATNPAHLNKVEELRREGAQLLRDHHHKISKLATSGMATGESMFREYYIFDEKHFAVEQRISVCMQAIEGKKEFNLLIWLDAGVDDLKEAPHPWSRNPPHSHLVPTILHKHMIALKSHQFASARLDDSDSSFCQAHSASHLPLNYGRSLRTSIMAHDAFYCLDTVMSFAASSHAQFLNLIEFKLDEYTSYTGDREFQILPHLKYTKQILYCYIQKTQRILTSIDNAKTPKWPKDESKPGHEKAAFAASSLEKDFIHLIDQAKTLHTRTTEAITVLMSSISIAENQKAMNQAQLVGRLTFLGFVFIPCSITTSFFGMNIKELNGSKVGLQWWALFTVLMTGAAVILFYLDMMKLSLTRIWNSVKVPVDKD